MKHWHLWKPADHFGSGETTAYFRVLKPYWSRSAANKAKTSMVNIGSGNLPPIVLECRDPRCRHRHGLDARKVYIGPEAESTQ